MYDYFMMLRDGVSGKFEGLGEDLMIASDANSNDDASRRSGRSASAAPRCVAASAAVAFAQRRWFAGRRRGG